MESARYWLGEVSPEAIDEDRKVLKVRSQPTYSSWFSFLFLRLTTLGSIDGTVADSSGA